MNILASRFFFADRCCSAVTARKVLMHVDLMDDLRTKVLTSPDLEERIPHVPRYGMPNWYFCSVSVSVEVAVVVPVAVAAGICSRSMCVLTVVFRWSPVKQDLALVQAVVRHGIGRLNWLKKKDHPIYEDGPSKPGSKVRATERDVSSAGMCVALV
jgi:hypothetical protein